MSDSDNAAWVEESLRRSAEFYGVTMEEAYRRYDIVTAHGGNPHDPICTGCARRPAEINVYASTAAMSGLTPEQYTIMQEGTYNPENGHFLCDECYEKNGSPSSPDGWICP